MTQIELYNNNITLTQQYTPYIFSLYGLTNIISCEDHKYTINTMLDCNGGIDYLVNYNGSLFGVANRVRFAYTKLQPFIYHQFTIRCANNNRCEFEKRINDIKQGNIYPKYTIQSWILDGNFNCSCLCQTIDLYNYILDNNIKPQYSSDHPFICVGWDDLKKHGYKIVTINN